MPQLRFPSNSRANLSCHISDILVWQTIPWFLVSLSAALDVQMSHGHYSIILSATHHSWTGRGGSPACWCRPQCPRSRPRRSPRPRGCCAWPPWPPRCSCSSSACPRCSGALQESLSPRSGLAPTRPQRAWECHSGYLEWGWSNVKCGNYGEAMGNLAFRHQGIVEHLEGWMFKIYAGFMKSNTKLNWANDTHNGGPLNLNN